MAWAKYWKRKEQGFILRYRRLMSTLFQNRKFVLIAPCYIHSHSPVRRHDESAWSLQILAIIRGVLMAHGRWSRFCALYTGKATWRRPLWDVLRYIICGIRAVDGFWEQISWTIIIRCSICFHISYQLMPIHTFSVGFMQVYVMSCDTLLAGNCVSLYPLS